MRTALIAIATAFFVTGCSSAPPSKPAGQQVPTLSTARQAVANLASASGSLVSGKVTLVPMANGGVHLTGVIGGLSPNSTHGFHVHEKGDCSAVDAASAGAHFNPFNATHGRAADQAHHAGDMDNLVADGEGVVRLNAHLGGVTLGGGAVNDIAGRALIVHAVPDDYRSQPAGNAGARVACGVIRVAR
jgi:Cu-Zn family superoxide dismutase